MSINTQDLNAASISSPQAERNAALEAWRIAEKAEQKQRRKIDRLTRQLHDERMKLIDVSGNRYHAERAMNVALGMPDMPVAPIRDR